MFTRFPKLHRCALSLCILCPGVVGAEVSIFAPQSPKAQYIKTELSNRLAVIESLKSSDIDILVTIGTSSFYEVPPERNQYSFPLFLSPYNLPQERRERSFPIYSEPDPETLVEYVSTWFKKARIGYLYSDDDPFSAALIESVVDSGLTLVARKVDGQDVFGALNALMKQNVDVFLVSKDPNLYTSSNIRFVFETLYRNQVPVIATSESLLSAGAIATISTDDRIILEDVAKIISALSSSEAPVDEPESIPFDPFSNRIEVKVNKIMEDRFGIHLHRKEKD